jgi:hypothetical protein
VYSHLLSLGHELKRNFWADNSGDTTILPCLIVFGSIFISGLLISLVLFIKKAGKKSLLPLTISIVIIAISISWIYYENKNFQNEIIYELEIKTNFTSNYTLLVPIWDEQRLQSNLEIKSGEGLIDFVLINESMTERDLNTALKVKSNDEVIIKGTMKSKNFPELSLDTGEYTGRNSLYWFWCNKTDKNQNISINLFAGIDQRLGGDYWLTEYQYRNEEFTPLENGWNKIKIKIESEEV